MSALTAEQRGDLAEHLLPIAARLACVVHGDGGARDAHQAIARLTRDQRDALLIVLAGLVDPDADLDQLLGYITWDEHGHPDRPAKVTGTVRDLAEDWWDTHWTTSSRPDGMTERTAAVIEDTAFLAAYGCSREDVARRVGLTSWNTLTVVHSRAGVSVPDLPRAIARPHDSAA